MCPSRLARSSKLRQQLKHRALEVLPTCCVGNPDVCHSSLRKPSGTGREKVAKEPRRTKSTTVGAKRTGITRKREGALNAIARKTGKLLDKPAAREAIAVGIMTAVATATAKRSARKAAREEVQELNAAQGGAAQSPGAMLGSALATAAGDAVRRLVSKGTRKTPSGTSPAKRSGGTKAKSSGSPKRKSQVETAGGASRSRSGRSGKATEKGSATAKRGGTNAPAKSRSSGTASRSGSAPPKSSRKKTKD